MVKLSHSAANKYADCPELFNLHYNKRYRPRTTHAALPFGSAVDAGVSVLLKGGTIDDARKTFVENWTTAKINDKVVKLERSTLLVYAERDLDTDLIELSDEEATALSKIKERKKAVGYANLSTNDIEYYNAANWACLYQKGILMLDTFQEKVLPNIEKVYDIQKRVEFKNDDGDEIVGYIDLVCKWKGLGDIILDIKTSSTEYESDSVKFSQQLALYASALGYEWAGFIVFMKQMSKDKTKICSRCGHDGSESRAKTCDKEVKGDRCKGAWNTTLSVKADVQIVLDKINDYTKYMIMENFMNLVHAIKQESYPKALSKCQNMYGKPCEMINYCWFGKDDDLVKLDKKE